MFTAVLVPSCTRDSQERTASVYKVYFLNMEALYSSETLVPP